MPATYTDRLQGLTTSAAVKPPCRAATTANITLSGLQTIDGVALSPGDRVLVKNQTVGSANGIYPAGTGPWSRALDFDGSLDVVGGTQFLVIEGATNADTTWRLAGYGPINVGSDTLAFENLSSDRIRAEAAADAAAANVEITHADVALALAAVGDAEDAAALAAGYIALIPSRITKGLATSITSNTTLTADPTLAIALSANATLVVRGRINYSTGATGDFKWSLSGPTATSVHINRSAIAPGDTALSAVGIDTAYAVSTPVTGGAGSGTVSFEAVIVNGNTAGTFAFTWAQNTSDATTTTVKAGSFVEYSPVPVTLTFPFPTAYDSTIAILGEFVGPFAGSGGHNYRQPVAGAVASYVDTVAHGSKVEALLFGDGSTFHYSVDGVAVSFVPSAGWNWNTFYSGSDGAHRITYTGIYIDADTAFRVTGLAPALTRPADLPTYYILDLHTSEIAQEGMRRVDTNGGTTHYQRIWLGGSGFGLKFKAATDRISLWMYDGTGLGFPTGRILVYQDGGATPIADVTPPSTTGTYAVIPLVTGLDGLSHTYEIEMVSRVDTYGAAALLVNNLDATALTTRPLICYYGDSVIEMADANYGAYDDARIHNAYLVAHAKGKSAVRVGHSGQKISTYLRDGVSELASLPQTPVVLVNEGGANDAIQAVPLATFQADYQTMLGAQRALFPSAVIYCEGIMECTTAWMSAATRTSYNAKISAAVTAMGDLNIIYKSTDGLIDPTVGVDTLDGIHLSPSGFTKRATFEATFIS